MNSVAVIVPYRDRGIDPLRQANLAAVLTHWKGFRAQLIVEHDGRTGSAQFNRSIAYNRAVARTNADVLIFTESDMLISPEQIGQAIEDAAAPGLVVPFTQYRYLTPEDSQMVREGVIEPEDATPEFTMDNGSSIGAVNVMSRETLETVGQFDPAFEGAWFDDNAMKRAFDICAGPTRWVDGPAYHLHHLPGWKGDHLTAEDKAATLRNKRRFRLYQNATTPERIRELTAGGQ